MNERFVMEIAKYINIGANILVGIANNRLRHECRNLHSLAAMMGVKEKQLEDRLAEIGYHYEQGLNQFRPDIK
ncbi:MAG: DUF4250 domain-containing protein [Colwellia sp.]|nr:DUF4250 domain-containing protein [Colwellia sp.]